MFVDCVSQIMSQDIAKLLVGTLCGMLDQYTSRGILLNPSIQFGRQHTYSTRCPAHFTMIDRCRLALSKHHFRQKATSWWNSLPLELLAACHSSITIFISI